MIHPASLLLLCTVLTPLPAAAALRKVRAHPRPAPHGSVKPNPKQLLRVITPVNHQTASAHPFVNVIVRFGATAGISADPATFRVRLEGANATALFVPIRESGAVVGMRAALAPSLLKRGHHLNRLRLEVRGEGTGRAAHLRAVDHLRFRAADLPDQPPAARALTSSDVIVSGVPLQFDATQSHDPELDVLTYQWDFGDGTTSSDPRPLHTFASNAADVTVRLTVSDGQLASTAELTMLAVPSLDPGRTPGVLKVDAPSAPEFGGVGLGDSATRTFTVRNGDPTPTSQLKVRLGACDYVWPASECERGGAFALDTSDLDLGPSESASVDLTFTPASSGHQSAQITVVASASNQNTVHLLSHGYGGAAPGTGPLPAADPLFYNAGAAGRQGIFPSGTRFVTDTTVRACSVANNGPGTGDVCLTDADCAANSGTCPPTSTCVSGTRVGQPCATPAGCPGGFCPSAAPFTPIDMDGDGEGGLYLLSNDGTFTDPNPNDPTLVDGTLLHVALDANGARSGAQIVSRTPTCTMKIASDAIPAAAGGEIYVAWYQSEDSNCFRSALEQLVTIRKSDGMQTVVLPRIDAVEGLDPCNDDYDPADDLEVARDGGAVFVALPGGIYRVRPTALLMTPDVDGVFGVHPDGSVVVVTATDQGPNGLLLVYKISPAQAENGAPHLSDLAPCATIEVPNNHAGLGSVRLTRVASFAVDPVAQGSLDGVILVSFLGTDGATVLPSAGQIRGTLAIASPAGTNTCNVIGLTNLEALDQMTF